MAPLTLIGLVLLGWTCGALINYLGDVLPATRRLTPARCPSCQTPLALQDYLILRKCRNCGKARSARAWIVQVVITILVTTYAVYPAGNLGFWPGLLLLIYFSVVIVIDMEHRLIMHPTSLVGAVIALGVGAWQHGIVDTLIGGAVGFAVMLGVYYLGALFAKWLARRRGQDTDEEAFGFGDVALSGVLGLLLGWPGITAGLFLAVLLGGAGSLFVVVYALIAKKFHSFMVVPYGPFLVIAAVLLLLQAK